MKEKIENLGKVAVTIEEGYWDIKKPYDKLTVVEREGTGTTFISRKPVPPGTSILNRKYWIKFSKWSDIPYELTQKFGDSEELAISQKTLTNKFSDIETEIREGDEDLDRRLRVVEVHERIMVEGGELEVATGYDLEHPESPRQEAAVPTVRAILDASDDEPHLNSTKRFVNSDNLAKTYGYYLDNPEFVYLLLDAEYHIIFGAKVNGDIVFGVGVPSQIQEYVEMKIKECSPEGYGDIVNFLDGIEFGDKKLQELLDEKVDKVEGKSLIDEEFANGIHYEENPEFVEVKLDGENKILEAIYKDGTKLLPAGYNVDGVIVKTFNNPEFLAVWLDNANHILFALDPDGNVIFATGVPKQIIEYIKEIIKPFEELFHFEENIEYIDIKLDAENKITEATRINGTKVLPGGAEFGGNIVKGDENLEYLEITTDAEGKIISSIDTELEDIKYGGINLSEMKRDADCDVLQCGYDADRLDIYTIENNDSTITMEVDDNLNVYEVKDSKQTAEIVIEDSGEVYLEQTIKEI